MSGSDDTFQRKWKLADSYHEVESVYLTCDYDHEMYSHEVTYTIIVLSGREFGFLSVLFGFVFDVQIMIL